MAFIARTKNRKCYKTWSGHTVLAVLLNMFRIRGHARRLLRHVRGGLNEKVIN